MGTLLRLVRHNSDNTDLHNPYHMLLHLGNAAQACDMVRPPNFSRSEEGLSSLHTVCFDWLGHRSVHPDHSNHWGVGTPAITKAEARSTSHLSVRGNVRLVKIRICYDTKYRLGLVYARRVASTIVSPLNVLKTPHMLTLLWSSLREYTTLTNKTSNGV